MLLRRFLRDERGAVSAEYGLAMSVVAFVLVTGLRAVVPRLAMDFGQVPMNF